MSALAGVPLWFFAMDAPERAGGGGGADRPVGVARSDERSAAAAVDARRRSGSPDAGATSAGAPAPDSGAADGGLDPVRGFAKAVEAGEALTVQELLDKNAKEADQYVDRFCEQAGKFRDGGVPQSHFSGERDAAPYLTRQIDFERPLDLPPGLLHLPAALQARLQGYGADWLTKIVPQDWQGLDFSWLKQLDQFDYWSALGAGPLRAYPVGNVLYEPIPNFTSVRYWVKLRYALGFARGDVAQASVEVRHLADLMRSQGLLVSELNAMMIYRNDAQARAAAASASIDVSNWPAMDPALTQAWGKMAWASGRFALPGVSEATMRKAATCMPSPCSGLVEGLGLGRSLGGYATADDMSVVTDLGAQAGCEADMISRAGAAHPVSPAEALMVLSDDLSKYFASPAP